MDIDGDTGESINKTAGTIFAVSGETNEYAMLIFGDKKKTDIKTRGYFKYDNRRIIKNWSTNSIIKSCG